MQVVQYKQWHQCIFNEMQNSISVKMLHVQCNEVHLGISTVLLYPFQGHG